MLPAFFGGEILGDDETTVRYVKAVSLSYFLDVSDEWKILVGDAWEKQLLNDVSKFAESYYPDLKVKSFIYDIAFEINVYIHECLEYPCKINWFVMYLFGF